MRISIISNLLLLCSLMGSVGMVAAKEGEVAIHFEGILREPPSCSINEGGQVEVPFGERVGVNKVDGVNYRQLVNYQIKCQAGEVGQWTLTLSLDGEVAGFDKQALQTNKADLGIRIYQNNTPFTPKTTLKIDRDNPPRLEAVPVKKAGTTLTEGAFEAWATLRAEYQ